MAVYRCEVKRISRGAARPQSAVAAAAYRTAQRLSDERSGQVHDYRRRSHGIAYEEIVAAPEVPTWATDRASLWNAAERAENRKNSVTAREALVSLPHELNEEQRIELARGFAQDLVRRYGVVADVAVHHPSHKGDDRNHHAHILFTTRRMASDGLTEKTRELDDRVSGPKEIEAIREMWERHQNLALERAGIQERVSRLSNAERGVDREPQAKLGGQFTAAERRGESPRLVDTWQEVARRRALTKDENRPDGEKRHRLERQALAGRYARQEGLRPEASHSVMRQNMAAQAEVRRREREERMARARAPGGVVYEALRQASFGVQQDQPGLQPSPRDSFNSSGKAIKPGPTYERSQSDTLTKKFGIPEKPMDEAQSRQRVLRRGSNENEPEP